MIRHTEVDGVRTVIAPTSGPMTAGLVFRVGQADETLATRGMTHLVEHLALHRHGLTDYHSNGMTARTNTHFYMRGPEDDVVAYFSGVCDSLANLPMERLETERTILRTEAAGRGSVNHALPLWRYGAQGYGLASCREFGIEKVRPEDVWWWARTWFTRENAVLWIAGDDVPRGLRLPLPGGVRYSVPRPTSALPITPAYFNLGEGDVVMDAVVRRSLSASVFANALGRRLFQHLRQEKGASYSAWGSYDPRGDGFATITAYADALPEKQDTVLDGFVEVLSAVRAGAIPQRDIDAGKSTIFDSLADGDASVVPAYAVNLLNGNDAHTLEELTEELHAVSAESVHAVAVEAMSSALLQVPVGRNADWAGFARAPIHSAGAVTGTRYVAREDSEVSLVIGTEGASVVTPTGPFTVRFAECVTELAWPDGGRTLVGADGTEVRFAPDTFYVHPQAIDFVDASVHPAAVVRMPPRDVGAVAPLPPHPQQRRRGTWLRTAVISFGWLVALAYLGFTLLMTIGVSIEASPKAAEWIGVGVFWVVGWPFWRAMIRRLRGRPLVPNQLGRA